MVRLRVETGDSDDDGEVETELRARLHAFNVAATGIDDGALLDATFQGHAVVKILLGTFTRSVCRELRRLEMQLGEDWRTRIVTDELAHLPLPLEHQQRVPHFRAQRPRQIMSALQSFYAFPSRDGWKGPQLERGHHIYG